MAAASCPRLLRLTRTGLAPVGSRQLRLARRVVTPVNASGGERQTVPLTRGMAESLERLRGASCGRPTGAHRIPAGTRAGTNPGSARAMPDS